MKKAIYNKIEIPENVEVNIDGSEIIIKGPEGENKKTFNISNLIFEKKDNQVIIGHKQATKREKKKINTITAHIKNMIKGVQEKFEYKLKICFSHFPISIEIKNNEAIIKNFLGEKIARKVKIPKGVDVKVEKDIITVSSQNKELAGQTAANFEVVTKIKNRDRRIFQDGCWIVSKSGKET